MKGTDVGLKPGGTFLASVLLFQLCLLPILRHKKTFEIKADNELDDSLLLHVSLFKIILDVVLQFGSVNFFGGGTLNLDLLSS